MFALKVNNEFIDLPADVLLELERNNPFLSDDEIQGEFSLGLTIRYSEKNYRLLQYTGNFYKGNKKYTVPAESYDNGIFRYAGQLVITQHSSNMNNVEQIIWTGFFTIGSASFLQSIQDVLLQDINYGGTRTFAWTTYNKDDGSNGFWQHFHAARTPNAFDYVFYPIKNEAWCDYFYCKWQNQMDSNFNFQVINNAVSICPAIYFSYFIEKLFSNFGWQLAGDLLNDTGFKKLTMPSMQAIKWCNYFAAGFIIKVNPFASISFNLADHVPQDVTIGSFLVSLKNRMGWYFDFDSNTKTATLRGNNTLIDSTVKDWTPYVMAPYTADYQDDDKIYFLQNNIDTADTFPVLNDVPEEGLLRAASLATLPTASPLQDGIFAYTLLEDSYYLCQQDSGGVYHWDFFSHNIGDYKPAGSNTPIESDISTMPSSIFEYRTGYNIKVPECHQSGNFFNSKNGVQPWGLRLLFYHGFYPDQKTDGTFTGSRNYPFASEDNLPLNGAIAQDWVLPYRHEYSGTNNGTYDYWWKAWLKLLAIQDYRTFALQLPMDVLRKFSFTDIILINNVFFIVQQAKETLPYKGLIEMKMKRIY